MSALSNTQAAQVVNRRSGVIDGPRSEFTCRIQRQFDAESCERESQHGVRRGMARERGIARRLVQFAFLLVALVCSAPAQQQVEDPAIGQAMKALAEARARCDWPATIERAAAAQRLARRGSDAWFEAAGFAGLALNEIWKPDDLERNARDVLDALAEARRAQPDAHQSALGPLPPRTASFVVGVELQLAHMLQSRGQHVEALGHLRFVLDDLRTGPCDDSDEWMGSAGVDAARSLLMLGRRAEARATSMSLRDNFPGSRAAAAASVLLQSGPDGIAAYRGKYVGDEEQARRMRSLLEAIPRVRARVAERLGWKLGELPEFPVGFVDLPTDWRELGALAEGDARRPNIAALVIVFSEPVALDMLDLETVLVHEFTHAALMGALGPAYHRLPFWLSEGISEAVAGQTDANMDFLLANLVSGDTRTFVSRDLWKLRPIVFEDQPCAESGTTGTGLAILPLVEARGIAGIRELIAELRAGRTLDDAFQKVMELDVRGYLALAHRRVMDVLEEKRLPAFILAYNVLKAEASAPAEVLSQVEEVIRDPRRGVAYGFALCKRAESLVKLRRLELALDAWRTLHDLRREYPSYVEFSRIGEARVLLELGRREEAGRAFRALARDAMTPTTARWAAEQAARVR